MNFNLDRRARGITLLAFFASVVPMVIFQIYEFEHYYIFFRYEECIIVSAYAACATYLLAAHALPKSGELSILKHFIITNLIVVMSCALYLILGNVNYWAVNREYAIQNYGSFIGLVTSKGQEEMFSFVVTLCVFYANTVLTIYLIINRALFTPRSIN